MATSTLIQRLETGEGGEVSHRRQLETYISGGAITAGDVVAFSTSATGADRAATVVQAAIVATGNALAAGVALDSASGAGEKVRVIVAGYAEDVKCDAGVAAGDPLSVAQATAGAVDTSVAADLAGCFGVALEAVAGGTVDLIVFKRF